MWALKLSATFAVAAIRTLTDAWALMLMWAWFVAPLGVPTLGFLHAVGLDLLVGLLVVFNLLKPAADQSWADRTAFALAKVPATLIIVAAGWLIQGAL